MDRITKAEIIEIIKTKQRFDNMLYDLIQKDIPDVRYSRIIRKIRMTIQSIHDEEMNYLVKTGQA